MSDKRRKEKVRKPRINNKEWPESVDSLKKKDRSDGTFKKILFKKENLKMKNEQATKIEYSTRRPENLAWRIESEGHVTYGKTRELALEMHKEKLGVCDEIERILSKCAAASME